jgi:nucleotide-binding universal stress UspA family protein
LVECASQRENGTMPDYRIMVAVDLNAGTDLLLAEAQRFARALDAIVDIVHIAEPDPSFVGYIKSDAPAEQAQLDSEREPHAQALRAEHRQTQAYGAKLRADGVRVDQTLMVQGPISETIAAEARKIGADLLILGSHHHGALYRFWYGDAVVDAARRPPCAVLVVPLPD